MKSISNRLSSQIGSQLNSRHYKKNLAVFLSMKFEIAEAVSDGWSIKSIWTLLKNEGKIDCGYVRFVRICNKHGITREQLGTETLNAKRQQNHAQKSAVKAVTTNPYEEEQQQAFHYRPTADIKELI